MSLERYLAELRDEGKPLTYSRLANLSNLSAEELTLFLGVWAGVSVTRQRKMMSRLVELAEENPNLNFDDIFAACLNDPDAEVRLSCIEGLWECESRSIIQPLITLLREASEETVRAAAAIALGRFALLSELGKLRPEDGVRVEQALLSAIEDGGEELEVHRRAIEAIAPLNLEKVKDIIHQAYISDNAKMRASAIYAMGRNGDPCWLPILVKELASPDAEIRFEAAAACGQLAEEEAVPHLARLIDDIDGQVQLCAFAALAQIGGSEAEEVLHRCLEHAEEKIRQAAREALEEMEFEKDPFSFRLDSPGRG